MMQYNTKTLETLGEILAPDCPKDIQLIFADNLKSWCIPWEQKEQKLSKQTLINHMKTTIFQSFDEYTGSTRGYMSYDQQRKLLYQLLFGKTAGESLLNRDFTTMTIGIGYNELRQKFTCSLLAKNPKLACSERQKKWCLTQADKHLPDHLKSTSDPAIQNQILIDMFPAWQEFGDFNTSLPAERPVTEKQDQYIKELLRNWE